MAASRSKNARTHVRTHAHTNGLPENNLPGVSQEGRQKHKKKFIQKLLKTVHAQLNEKFCEEDCDLNQAKDERKRNIVVLHEGSVAAH